MPCSLPLRCCGTMRLGASCSKQKKRKLSLVVRRDKCQRPRTTDQRPIPMKRIAILGSTGSIGRSTLSVVESFPERFQVVSLAAGSNLDAAFDQARTWRPRVISMATEADAETLRLRLLKS